MKYSGMIWNSGYNFKDDILNDISQKGKLLKVREYDLEGVYDNFVRDMYEDDQIADWKVQTKLDCMNQFKDKKVIVFDLNIENPTFEYVERKKRETCFQIETLKEDIRDKYSRIIQPYFFDTILHISDDKREDLVMQKVLHKYQGYMTKETTHNGAGEMSQIIGSLLNRQR